MMSACLSLSLIIDDTDLLIIDCIINRIKVSDYILTSFSLLSFTKGFIRSVMTSDALAIIPSLLSSDTPETSSNPPPSTRRCPGSSGASTTRDPTSRTASSPDLATTPSVLIETTTDDLWPTRAGSDRWEDDPQTCGEVSSDDCSSAEIKHVNSRSVGLL